MSGALIISLDFELLWGLRDLYPSDGGVYRANLLGARAGISRTLRLFEEFEISATWATVGMLFANSRAEIEQFGPRERPNYDEARFDPYRDSFGDGEEHEPFRYARSVITEIANTPGQEIGTHTFSHYYPLEAGHDDASFRADLRAAATIGERYHAAPRSLVVPRNQFNVDDLPVIAEAGLTSVRTNAVGWPHRASPNAAFRSTPARFLRLLDSYAPLTGNQVFGWDEISVTGGVACIPASHFLRPAAPCLKAFEPLRFRRLARTIRTAARSGKVCHLWWHPHNFGANQDENFAFLRRLLEVYRDCRERYGMASLSMADTAEAVLPRGAEAWSQTLRSSGSSFLADLPDLLCGPAARPLASDKTEIADGFLRGLDFDKVFNLETVRAEESNPITGGEVKLGRSVRPIESAETEVVAEQEGSRRLRLVVRQGQHLQQAVAEQR